MQKVSPCSILVFPDATGDAALLLVLTMLLPLAACSKRVESNPEDAAQDAVMQDDEMLDDSVVQPEDDGNQDAVSTDSWSGLLNVGGFVSNEAAYAMKRSEWHALAEPDISQVSYYGDYQVDGYFYTSPDATYGFYIECNYDINDLDNDPAPAIIKLIDFRSDDFGMGAKRLILMLKNISPTPVSGVGDIFC